jgi:NAD(P)H-flavin reductase
MYISSAAEDHETTHHIKSYGPGTFSGKLHDLFRESHREAANISLNIEGPYGAVLPYHRYEKIVFVAGGIGVAPVHSQFKTLYVLAKAGLLPVTRVHLVWVAKDPALFGIFRQTFQMIANDSLHTRFKFDFYVTQEYLVGLSEAPKPPIDSDFQPNFKLGRPNLQRELAVGLSAYGMHALIYSSG